MLAYNGRVPDTPPNVQDCLVFGWGAALAVWIAARVVSAAWQGFTTAADIPANE